jgi:hypothetical protein
VSDECEVLHLDEDDPVERIEVLAPGTVVFVVDEVHDTHRKVHRAEITSAYVRITGVQYSVVGMRYDPPAKRVFLSADEAFAADVI